MIRTISLLVTFSFLGFGALFSQGSHISVNYLGPEDGLSFRHVTSIIQDNDGFMWIGTRNGLNKFDGYQFTSYTDNPKSVIPLANNYVHDLEIDKNGSIWVGTETGLNIIHPYTKHVQTYTRSDIFDVPSQVQSIDEITITVHSKRVFLHTHEIKDNNYLYTTAEYVDGKFKTLHLTHEGITYDYFANVFESADEKLYVRPANTLIYFQLNNHHEIVNVIHLPEYIDSIRLQDCIITPENDSMGTYKRNLEFIQDPSEELMLNGTFCDAEQTYMFYCDLKNQLYEINSKVDFDGDYMPVNQFIDQEQNIWFQKGKQLIVQTDDQFLYIQDERWDLNSNVVTCFYQSEDGTVWVGTNFGIYRCLKRNIPFQFYLSEEKNSNGFGKSIRALAVHEDILYAGVVHDGMWKVDLTTKKEKKLFDETVVIGNKEHTLLPYGIIAKDEKLWISNWYDNGIYSYDLKSDVLEYIATTGNDHGFGRSLVLRDDGNIWQATEKGLNLINTQEKIVSSYIPKKGAEALQDLHITATFLSPQGTLWIGSKNNGLFKLTEDGDFSLVVDKSMGLSSNVIHCLYADEKDLWIGTPSGLNKVDVGSKEIITYSPQDGLPDNEVYGVLRSGEVLWLSTNNGIVEFNPENETIKKYDTKDGLSHNEFNYISFLASNDGSLFFGGMNGVTQVAKTVQATSKDNTKLILTRFEKFDGKRDGLFGYDVNVTEGIDIFPEDKFFTFEFALLDYFSNEGIRYAYKLEGFDEEWNALGTDNSIRFNTLPAGDYTLMVKAKNLEGVWSNSILRIPIRVHQPFYRSIWFFLLVILLLAALFYAIYRIKINRIRKIERLRTKIASDLHDDVGSMLTQISMQADLIQQQVYTPEEEKQEIDQIAVTSREAVKTMSDVVWSIDARQEQMGDLINRMKDYALEMLSRTSIEMQFQTYKIDESDVLKLAFRQNVYLIFKEAINNIIKHSNATEIAVSIRQQHKGFEMIISDNGSESKNPDKRPGQGLKNMKMRAQQIRGSLTIDKQNGYQIRLVV